MDSRLHKQYQDLEESHWLFKVRDNILKDIAKKYFKQNANILDFGCNYGHSVQLLQKLGYQAQGVDISEGAIQYGKSVGIQNIFLGGEKKFNQESFDVVIALDVIEHIKDDQQAIKEIVRMVKPGGLIVIAVPAYMFLWGVQDEIAHHFRRYTMSQLISLSKKAGDLDVVRKTYLNTLLFLPIALFRLGSRIVRRRTQGSDLDVNNAFLNTLFFGLFDFERRILKHINMPFGVTALLILRKKD